MSLNKPGLTEIEKEAERRGYSWNSDNSKMTDGKGGWLKPSDTGGSVKTKDRQFNNPSDAKKSKGW